MDQTTQFTDIDPAGLRLPACPIPRPGDQVCWYADARMVRGTLISHTIDGCPQVVNEFGNPVIKESFAEIRLIDPFARVGPNWTRLPAGARVMRPPEEVLDLFEQILKRRIPPGPSYMDLVTEIWSRGFEVFVVGGTVRDVLARVDSHDVDLVTTMPLILISKFLRSMYRYDPRRSEQHGFVRIGGTPQSKDPFIDVKVFSDSLTGTKEAAFGVGFDRDVLHRDFACNALYFDPINQVIIDPCGIGLRDCAERKLTLVCNTKDPYQHAQIFVRFFKFCSRGFVPVEETSAQICQHLVRDVSSMTASTRIRYVRAQIVNKCAEDASRDGAVDAVRNEMVRYGMAEVWEEFFAPILKDILA